MRILILILILLAALFGAIHGAEAQTADRLYLLDCGHNAARDQSLWSPGVDVGKPIEMSDTCALIRHGAQWFLWDTGYPDAVADRPVDTPVGHATRSRKLAADLDMLGVRPADIAYVAVSHTHADHVGNVDLFADATLLIQKAELDWAFAAGRPAPFRRDRPTRALEGDLDVFGDGSVTLLSTPGHTPGHQSLLVHLANTGWIVLTGDAAHFQSNWDNDRVPRINTDAAQTHQSRARLAGIVAEKNAALWINHDLPTFERLKHAPQFYD
jgi:glyoxylase-like metal-dependent hydrolase (beta-lactamase superfamily II)